MYLFFWRGEDVLLLWGGGVFRGYLYRKTPGGKNCGMRGEMVRFVFSLFGSMLWGVSKSIITNKGEQIMKKRIRKKKCIGEFKELAFHLSAKYGKLETEAANEFLSRILEKGNELGLLCGGTFEADHFDFYIVSGRINTRNEERRQEMVAFVKSLPGVESVEAGEFVDAWYTPIEDDCCCDCGCEDHDHNH